MSTRTPGLVLHRGLRGATVCLLPPPWKAEGQRPVFLLWWGRASPSCDLHVTVSCWEGGVSRDGRGVRGWTAPSHRVSFPFYLKYTCAGRLPFPVSFPCLQGWLGTSATYHLPPTSPSSLCRPLPSQLLLSDSHSTRAGPFSRSF